MPTGVLISTVAAFVGLGVGLYFTLAVLRRRIRKEPIDRRAVALCGVGWAVALGSYVVTDNAFARVGQLTGMPNLAWLLGYWVLIICLHYVGVMASLTLRSEPSKIERSGWSALAVIILLTIIFFAGGIAYSPINLVRTLPRTVGELVYIQVTQTYVAYVFAEPLWMSGRILFGERSTREARIRSSILAVVFGSGIAFSILRIVMTTSAYYSLITDPTLILGMQMTTLIFFAATILLWPFAFVPSKWVKLPIQAGQLADVRYLYRELESACGAGRLSPIEVPASWWARLSKCRFYVDMVSVFVMDVKWLVREGGLTIRDGRLLAAVNALDETLPPDQLVARCAETSRRLKRLDRQERKGIHAPDC